MKFQVVIYQTIGFILCLGFIAGCEKNFPENKIITTRFFLNTNESWYTESNDFRAFMPDSFIYKTRYTVTGAKNIFISDDYQNIHDSMLCTLIKCELTAHKKKSKATDTIRVTVNKYFLYSQDNRSVYMVEKNGTLKLLNDFTKYAPEFVFPAKADTILSKQFLEIGKYNLPLFQTTKKFSIVEGISLFDHTKPVSVFDGYSIGTRYTVYEYKSRQFSYSWRR